MAEADGERAVTEVTVGLGPDEVTSILAAAHYRASATAAGRVCAMFAEVLARATPETIEQLRSAWIPALAGHVTIMSESVTEASQQIFATQQFNAAFDPVAAQAAYDSLRGKQPFPAKLQLAMAAGAEKAAKKAKVATVVNPTKDQKEQHYGPGGDKGKNGGRGN